MNFKPHDYQSYAIEYIENHPVSAVLLDMGLGKTVISLTAIADLLFDSFMAHRILVIAPLRVARDTWPAELKKWTHLNHLTFAVAVKAQVDNGVHCVGRQPGQTGRQPERPGFGCMVQDSDVHIGSDAVSTAGVVHIVLIVFSTVPGGKINGVKHSWFLRFRRFRVDRLSQIETA